jgi:hypothetical protein
LAPGVIIEAAIIIKATVIVKAAAPVIAAVVSAAHEVTPDLLTYTET